MIFSVIVFFFVVSSEIFAFLIVSRDQYTSDSVKFRSKLGGQNVQKLRRGMASEIIRIKNYVVAILCLFFLVHIRIYNFVSLV